METLKYEGCGRDDCVIQKPEIPSGLLDCSCPKWALQREVKFLRREMTELSTIMEVAQQRSTELSAEDNEIYHNRDLIALSDLIEITIDRHKHTLETKKGW